MKNKKLIALITSICLIFTSMFALSSISYGVSNYHSYTPNKEGVANLSAVMRKSASSNSDKIVTVPGGEKVKVYGYMEVPGTDWYKVQFGNKKGYIRKDLITITKSLDEYHNYSPDKEGVVLKNSVLRQNASSDSKKLLTVPKDKSVVIYGYMEVPGENWYKVKYSNKTGYIRVDLVKVITTSVSNSNKFYNYSPDKKGKTTANINLRKNASVKAEKITNIPSGKNITIYGYKKVSNEKWYSVKYGSKKGYVSAKYVKITGVLSKPSSITGSGITSPVTITQGHGFAVKGTLKSTYDIKEVKAGIMNVSSGKFYNQYTGVAKPNSKTYDLSRLDSKVAFSKVKAGTYYYTIIAKDSKNKSFTVNKKKFKVVSKESSSKSTLNIKNASTPEDGRIYGEPFLVKGLVTSNHELKNVQVKVIDTDGDVVKNCNESVNPTGKEYDIRKLDNDVKVSKLKNGRYTYKVIAKDSKTTKTLVNSKFTVVGINTSTMGKTLRYNVSKFKKIGKQPYSGPCGLYAMAYGRLVIDGDFTIKSKYKSVCDQLRHDYGLNSNTAHWYEAGAVSVWSTSAKAAYQGVLNEINNGRPCIIPVATPRGTNHFVTVIGYKRGTTASNVNLSRLVILDPAYGHQTFGNDHGYMDKSKDNARYIKYEW